MHRKTQTGFTLLEVIMAMALTGFVLGSLFTLVAGSKQLSWRSETSLHDAMQVRAATNFALLQNTYSDVEPVLQSTRLEIRALDILEPPERKTQISEHTLEYFEVVDPETATTITGSRWVRLEVAQ